MTTRPGVRTGISEGMGAALGTFDHEDVLEEGRLVVAAVVAQVAEGHGVGDLQV